MKATGHWRTWLWLGVAGLVPSGARAQGPIEHQVLAVVRRLFDGMRAGDSGQVRSVFDPAAAMLSVLDSAGVTVVRPAAVDRLVAAVGQPHSDVWDERIRDPEVRVDGGLAAVWVPYAFYRGDRFSHCGVDLFHLVRRPQGWRIMLLADTRRTAPCPELPGQEPGAQAAVARIKAEGRAHSEAARFFDYLTTVIGPRLTGSPAFRQAADWSAQQFRRIGLANVHLESWPFGRGWTLEKLTLELVAPRYVPLVGYPEAWTPSTKGVLVGTPVYIGDLTADQVRARKAELAGKIVLPWAPQTRFIERDRLQPSEHDQPVPIGAPPAVTTTGPVDRRELGALMKEVGAAAILTPNQGRHGTVFVLGNRTTPDDAVPSVILAAEHYNLIVRLVQAGQAPVLRLEVRSRYHTADTNGYNVLAELPGTDPRLADQVVMVGAHLDSWHAASGATDNADAVASLLEAARLLVATGLKPRRTIRFALWGGEEQGLLGSRAYVQQHLAGEANAAARARFSVYFNHDPGTGPIYGWYLEQNAAVRPIFDAWLAPLADLGVRRNVMDRIGSTDHLSFIAAGLPAFNTVQDYTDYDTRTHHTNADFAERVKPEDLTQAAIVLAVFAYQAAMREELIPRAPASP